MALPAVTVTIPTYDAEEPLDLALASVERQTYDGPIECLVLDNSESQVARSTVADVPFASYHWQLDHVPRKTEGMANVAVARDLGCRYARGEYVHLLDASDELRPTAIEAKLAAIDRHPVARACYSALEKSDGTIKRLPEVVRGNELAFTLTNLRPPALPSMLLVERDVILACPPRRTLPHEDIAGLIELLLRTPLAYVDDPLTVRNEPPTTATSTASDRGRIETHDRYAGLRETLLSERHQAVATSTCDDLRSKCQPVE